MCTLELLGTHSRTAPAHTRAALPEYMATHRAALSSGGEMVSRGPTLCCPHLTLSRSGRFPIVAPHPPFPDEVEEFHMLLQHYCVLMAVSDVGPSFVFREMSLTKQVRMHTTRIGD